MKAWKPRRNTNLGAWDSRAQDRARGKTQVCRDFLFQTESSCWQTALTFSHQAETFRTVFTVVAICGPGQRRLHGSSLIRNMSCGPPIHLPCMCHAGRARLRASACCRSKSPHEVIPHTFHYRRVTQGTGTTRPSKKSYRAMVSIRFIIFAMIQCLAPVRCGPSEDHGA